MTDKPDKQSKEEKAIWDEYRMGKMQPSIGGILDNCVFFNPDKKTSKTREMIQHPRALEPRPGSTYWLWHFTVPHWFRSEARAVQEAGIMLRMVRQRVRSKREKRKDRRRKRRGR